VVQILATSAQLGLGRYRWVVERTFAWLHQFKRLLVRYDRGAESIRSACPSIAWRQWEATTLYP
jgi:transposase